MALAEKIGKSQELISKWCNNLNMPNIVDLVNLSTILQVSVINVLNCFGLNTLPESLSATYEDLEEINEKAQIVLKRLNPYCEIIINPDSGLRIVQNVMGVPKEKPAD